MNENRFYVYEWYNVDTGEVFYVGKGTGYRYNVIKGRNSYFLNYYNKYNCQVKKYKENLTEAEAFELEKEVISKYKNVGMCKCNLDNGGTGARYTTERMSYLKKSLSFGENSYSYKDLENFSLEELENIYEDRNKENSINPFKKAIIKDGELIVDHFRFKEFQYKAEKNGVVYQVENKVNGRKYIGMSGDFEATLRCFRSEIYNNSYKEDVMKYGIENFEISELARIEYGKLSIIKQTYVALINPYYNKSKDKDKSNKKLESEIRERNLKKILKFYSPIIYNMLDSGKTKSEIKDRINQISNYKFLTRHITALINDEGDSEFDSIH